MLTEEAASVALNFGADDMDGTVGGERIAHDAGAISPMKLARDHIVRIIRDAGKIPVERDAYYNPLRVHAGNVIGRIPYLNSVPFYADLPAGEFKVLPVVPRRMGMLADRGELEAGPFSLMDYFRIEGQFELLPWCIATRDQVKSVMLFSKGGWKDLEGGRIGIMDDTATSVRLLEVLLAKKYGVHAGLQRLHAGVNDYSMYDAVLLIGDEALRRNAFGLPGFELVFDLASEWYVWQKLPFVFAVWAVDRRLDADRKARLSDAIGRSLDSCSGDFVPVAGWHGRSIGFTDAKTQEYLEGFNFRLGEREREAMQKFRALVSEVESSNVVTRA